MLLANEVNDPSLADPSVCENELELHVVESRHEFAFRVIDLHKVGLFEVDGEVQLASGLETEGFELNSLEVAERDQLHR